MAAQSPIKKSFFPYKQVSGGNGDRKWLRMSNAFILCDILWKVIQWTEEEVLNDQS